MISMARSQLNDKISFENKINELIISSKTNIDHKMKLITDLLSSIKEENEQIISKSKYISFF